MVRAHAGQHDNQTLTLSCVGVYFFVARFLPGFGGFLQRIGMNFSVVDGR
jgi:hypothetical protein